MYNPKNKKRKREDEKELDSSIKDTAFAQFDQCKNGTKISKLKVSDEKMPYLVEYLRLHVDIKNLELKVTRELVQTVPLLANINTLTHLTLYISEININLGRVLEALSSHRSLTSLEINSGAASLDDVSKLLENTLLETLCLSDLWKSNSKEKIGDKIVNILSKHLTVTSLGLIRCGITSKGVIPFLENKQLKELNLEGNYIYDEGICELSKHPTLTSLSLGYTIRDPQDYSRISHRGIASLLAVKNLTRLALPSCNLKDQDLYPFLENRRIHLIYLDLKENLIGDEGAYYLSATYPSSLTTLCLSECKISENGTTALANHPHITDLEIGSNPIHIAGLIALVLNPSLRKLRFSIDGLFSHNDKENLFNLKLAFFFLHGNRALCSIQNHFPTSEVDETTLSKDFKKICSRNVDWQSEYDQKIEENLSEIITKLPNPLKIIQEYLKGEYPYCYDLFYDSFKTVEQLHTINKMIEKINKRITQIEDKYKYYLDKVEKNLLGTYTQLSEPLIKIIQEYTKEKFSYRYTLFNSLAATADQRVQINQNQTLLFKH